MDLPEKSFIPDPYNVPVHNQGDKNNCTAHAYAASIELTLSRELQERVTVDVDDLWEKQKNFGTATEDEGDTVRGCVIIAAIHGVKFETESGKLGIFYPGISAKSQLIWISQ
jgi:hypothetical protein